MTEAPETLTNQTLFGNEEPILQGDTGPVLPVEPLTPEELLAQKKRKKMMKIVGGVGAAFLVLLVLLVAISPKRKALQVSATPTPSPVSQASRTEFQARLDELSSDLNNADPSKSNLTAPPVDMTLSLYPLPR